jgi:hypothetical protein
MTLLMLLLSLAACPLPPLAPLDDPARETMAVPADRVRRWLCGESDWEPDSGMALAAARERLHAAFRHWLAVERPSLGDRFLAPDHLNRLLARPDVLWRQDQQRRERGYGTMWRVRLEIGIRDATLDDWANDIRRQTRLERRWFGTRVGGNAVGFLLVLLLVSAWDRWTHGYRRSTALWMCGGLALTVTIVVWWG